jgi:hypothetical protein
VFASAELAARIDRAEGRLCAGIADAVRRESPDERSAVIAIGGGVAVYAAAGSPTNKMIGVGFDGVPPSAELDHVEALFSERDAALQVEVSTLSAPAFHATLVRRGYQVRGFENQLGHPLTTVAPVAVERPFDISRTERHEHAALARVIGTAFANTDGGSVAADVPMPEDGARWFELTMSVRGFEGFAARREGTLVGGASMRIDDGVAQFCGAATLPAYRRCGVQTALIRLRLLAARESGCDVAVVTTEPGSRSQRNVQREGFSLLYARQIFVKEPGPRQSRTRP